MIFDRGFDAKLLDWLYAEGVTYHTGEPKLHRQRFSRRRARFGGRRVHFVIAEDSVEVKGSGPWRRIVVLILMATRPRS